MVSSNPTEAELILRFPSTFPKFGSSIVGLEVVLSDGDGVGSKLDVGCEEGNVDSSSIIDIGAYAIRFSSSYRPANPINGSYPCCEVNMLRLTDFWSFRSRISGFEESLSVLAEAEETKMYIDRAKKALKKVCSSFMVVLLVVNRRQQEEDCSTPCLQIWDLLILVGTRSRECDFHFRFVETGDVTEAWGHFLLAYFGELNHSSFYLGGRTSPTSSPNRSRTGRELVLSLIHQKSSRAASNAFTPNNYVTYVLLSHQHIIDRHYFPSSSLIENETFHQGNSCFYARTACSCIALQRNSR